MWQDDLLKAIESWGIFTFYTSQNADFDIDAGWYDSKFISRSHTLQKDLHLSDLNFHIYIEIYILKHIFGIIRIHKTTFE